MDARNLYSNLRTNDTNETYENQSKGMRFSMVIIQSRRGKVDREHTDQNDRTIKKPQ